MDRDRYQSNLVAVKSEYNSQKIVDEYKYVACFLCRIFRHIRMNIDGDRQK